MKQKKRTTALVALALGITITTVSALADVVAGSGYGLLKDAVKQTSASLSSQLDSVTLEASIAIKLDGVVTQSQHTIQKLDMANNARENTEKETRSSGYSSDFYHYSDRTKYIYHNSDNDVYRVSNYSTPQTSSRPLVSDPFKEDVAEDAERILDALVGNLSDLIQVVEDDGTKMFTGSLSRSQVPALVNAVTSFGLKQATSSEYQREELSFPQFASDIYIEQAYGKAIQNPNGILEDVILTGSLTGKDKGGATHTVEVEFFFGLKDINSTVVAEPDLTGKKVEYSEEPKAVADSDISIYTGTYKTPITKLEDGKFIKIGEKVLVLDCSDPSNPTGHYYESYTTDQPDFINDIQFTLSNNPDESHHTEFIYLNSDGEEKTGVLQLYLPGTGSPEASIATNVVYTSNDKRSYRSDDHITLRMVFE